MSGPADIRRPILLATGGTGGHVFPAQALAAELAARGWPVAVATDARGTAFGSGIETHALAGGSPSSLGGALRLGRGIFQARGLVRRLTPAAVVGFGGYASVAAVLAGRWAGIATALHEQNAVLGRANRLLAPGVRRLALSFADTGAVRPGDRGRVVVTGNPVRPDVAAVGLQAYPPVAGRLSLLATGGSQGARVLGEVLPAAFALLAAESRVRIDLVQQVRAEAMDAVRAAYAALGMASELSPFFADMPRRLAAAHVVIGRAGASTVAELAAAGRPGLLVPYPHAMDDHQTANAAALARAGGGWMLPEAAFTPKSVAARLAEWLDAPESLAAAAASARTFGRPDAARALADLVEACATEAPAAIPGRELRSLAA